MCLQAMLVEKNATGKYKFTAKNTRVGDDFVMTFSGSRTDVLGLATVVIIISLVIALVVGVFLVLLCSGQINNSLKGFSKNKILMKQVVDLKVSMERPQQNEPETGQGDMRTGPDVGSTENARMIAKRAELSKRKKNPVRVFLQLDRSFFEVGEVLVYSLEDTMRNSLKEYTEKFIQENAGVLELDGVRLVIGAWLCA